MPLRRLRNRVRLVAAARLRGLQALGPPLLAAALAVIAVVAGWRGVDWPAQVYRVELVRAHGLIGFDVSWYGGQFPLAYSVLFPALAAATSLAIVAVASAATATWAFQRLVRDRFGLGGSLAAYLFATATTVQVAIGQLPFLLGFTFALLATLGFRRRTALAILAALAAALTSSAAAFFLALAALAAAIGWPRQRWRGLVVVVASLAPVAAMQVIYHQGKTFFPFPWWDLLLLLSLCGLGFVLIPRRERLVRLGMGIYGAAAICAFVVPTSAGDVITRLGTYAGVPIVVAIAVSRRKAVFIPPIVTLLVWQWSPAVGAITTAGTDPSSHPGYYAPLVGELNRLSAGPVRIEIPMTAEHWEAAFVAPTVSLARGWERQIDTADNPIFYQPDSLTTATYQAWLNRNGISFVAVPDAHLDYSARAEAALIQSDVTYLQPVWHNAHWQLWQVNGSPGLVSGPAHLSELSANSFTVTVDRPGSVLVRVRASATFAIPGGGGCLSRSPDGWISLDAFRPGPLTAVAGLLPDPTSQC